MTKNYRFEILNSLYQSTETSYDINPLIKSMADENIFSRMYFSVVLQTMRENELIDYTDDGDEIIARLLPAGIEEYQRLKKHVIAYGPVQTK